MTDAKPPEKAPSTEPLPPKPAAQESPAAFPPGAPRSDPAKVAQSLGAALKAFWTSFPGILTAIGGLIAAAATLITALDKAVWLRPASIQVTPTAIVAPAASPMPTLVATSDTGAMPTAVPPTAAPSATPTTGAVLPEGGLLADDFSDPQSGWQTETAKEYKLAYVDGSYSILVHEPQLAVWGTPIRPYAFGDLIFEADAWQVAGPLDVDYGLVVRCQGEEALYLFAISSEGSYSVQLLQKDTWKPLVEWTTSKAVKPQGQVNHLKVECVGATMMFQVNGQQVVQLTDDALRSGNIGLLLSTFDQGEAEVRFDNVRVQVLKRF
jgi:hypothetical protein